MRWRAMRDAFNKYADDAFTKNNRATREGGWKVGRGLFHWHAGQHWDLIFPDPRFPVPNPQSDLYPPELSGRSLKLTWHLWVSILR